MYVLFFGQICWLGLMSQTLLFLWSKNLFHYFLITQIIEKAHLKPSKTLHQLLFVRKFQVFVKDISKFQVFVKDISNQYFWFWSRFLPVLSWYMKIVHNIRKIGVMNQYLFIVYRFQNQVHVHVDSYSVFVWLLSNFIDFGLHWVKCSKNNCYGLVIIQSCIWIWVLISLIQIFYMS